jgi:ubiquitin-conjugating enzyme E2 Q
MDVDGEEYAPCPFCGHGFEIVELTMHAGECERKTLRAISGGAAPQQQHQQVAPSPPRQVACAKCKGPCAVDDLFILDECSCKYHRKCIASTIRDSVAVSVNVCCPACQREISMRDQKELLPSSGGPVSAAPSEGAAARLLAELQLIKKSNAEKSGFSVAPVKKNLFLWEVRLFGFDGELGDDMKRARVDHILMEVSFPPNFPFAPPFCRVIRPRFVFMTGHITIGGSVCTELLTQSGWVPQTTIESVIVSIRVEMMAGNGRLDVGNRQGDYTMAEAKDAFERMRKKHKW